MIGLYLAKVSEYKLSSCGTKRDHLPIGKLKKKNLLNLTQTSKKIDKLSGFMMP
jgi:hypothetical protein